MLCTSWVKSAASGLPFSCKLWVKHSFNSELSSYHKPQPAGLACPLFKCRAETAAFLPGTSWMKTTEAVTNNKKEYLNCLPKKFVTLRELETWPQKARASSDTCFPGAHLQLIHYHQIALTLDVIPFCPAMQGSYPHFTDDETASMELCISTRSYQPQHGCSQSLPSIPWLAPSALPLLVL